MLPYRAKRQRFFRRVILRVNPQSLEIRTCYQTVAFLIPPILQPLATRTKQ